MSEFKEFLNLFLRRFFRPVSWTWKKIYNLLPQPIKSQLTTYNLQLITLISILLIFLINQLWPRDIVFKTILKAARWPILPVSHFQLAKIYFENGNETKAKKEFETASTSFRFLLGRKIFPSWQKEAEETKQLVFKKEDVEKKVAYWEQVLENNPSFRDVYLRLTVLYYQLWQDEKAKEIWQKAFYLDPNNKIVQEVGEILIAE